MPFVKDLLNEKKTRQNELDQNITQFIKQKETYI